MAGFAAQGATASPTVKTRGNPGALWQLVHGACSSAAAHHAYPPAPCIEVISPQAPASGYAVFKDRDGRYQYLVIPLARIAGIESPALQTPDAPNYFADAWTAHLYVEAALHRTLPRGELSLAVNSTYGRTQNQLHIHVDCLRPEVHEVLQRLLPTLTRQWRPLRESLPPHRHAYQARWVGGETLSINPFRSLASALPAADQMALHSLIVVDARSPGGEPGFILLSGRVDHRDGDRGSGEELQDHACRSAAAAEE